MILGFDKLFRHVNFAKESKNISGQKKFKLKVHDDLEMYSSLELIASCYITLYF
jgi:hypothetical protein